MILYHPPLFFQGKKIVLGVSGGIAAFKAASVASYLTKAGAEVTVCMTEHAQALIGKSTFEAITGREVHTDLFSGKGSIIHIALARESEAIFIVPATANIIGKIASGIADDLLTTLALVDPKKVIVAPSMNVSMWRNALVQENIKKIQTQGVQVVFPSVGTLACGEEGEGRLPEPENLVEELFYRLHTPRALTGKRVLITAGATREWLDPVRFISNPSSGLMGCALAAVAKAWGAEVTMILASSGVRYPSGVVVERVETVSEMEEVLERYFPSCDVLFMSAAISDFRPASFHPSKIKKEGRDSFTLSLVPTVDLLESLSTRKEGRVIVGFCAETENPLSEARKKLRRKNLDLIVANLVKRGSSGFESLTNQAWIVDREGKELELPLLDKRDLAEKILTHVALLFFS
ncbi:MAG: bifunctional phosphopantothenoylcysteine decarboxylase/phosphopantothenate--cysteine ligase CoaBC [Candidatus Caldatribacteriaceae bacterium]